MYVFKYANEGNCKQNVNESYLYLLENKRTPCCAKRQH